MNERELFEKWLEENYPIIGLDLTEIEGVRYLHKSTRNMWDAWQASSSRKGYKLVPTEPTEDMIRLGECSHHGYDNIDARTVYKTMIGVVK